MAQSVTIVPYQIKVKRKGKEEYCPLDQLDGQFLFHTFRKFLESHQFAKEPAVDEAMPAAAKPATVDDDDQVAFRVVTIEPTGSPGHDVCQTIEAMVEIGHYGQASKLLHLETMEERAREKEEADLAPFYVRLDLHNGHNTATLLIQEFGRQRARGTFTKQLRRYFVDNPHFGNLVLKCDSIVTEEYLDTIASGGVKSLRFFRDMMAKDASQRLVQGMTERLGTIELVVRPPKMQAFSMRLNEIISAVRGQMPANSLITIEDNAEYDKVKIEIDYHGRRRTINLNRREGLVPYMAVDVTDELEFENDTNHPTFDSLRACLLYTSPSPRDS